MAKKKAKKKAKSGGSAKKQREPLVVASKAKAFLKDQGCMVASDALDGLNEVVYWYLEQAAKRCTENKRSTVRPHDFIAF